MAYTDNLTGAALCTQDISNVALTNGVFHLKLNFNCSPSTLAKVLAQVPAAESVAIRITDLSNSKQYSYQALHSIPFANVASQLVQLNAAHGQFLKWNNNDKKWEPGSVSGGTVTNVSVSSPLSISTPATTPNITIPQADGTTDGYLSNTDWNTFYNKQPLISTGTTSQYYRGDKSWQALDTDVVAEGSNLYFTNSRVLGLSLTGFSPVNNAITDTDSVILAFGKTQGQIDSLNSASNNFLVKNNTDSITGLVNVGTTGLLQLNYLPVGMNDAVNKSYTDTKLNLTGGTLSGALNLDNVLNLKGAANYVTVKAHATSSTYNFILPQNAGTTGYVLQTDGAGNLSWINPSSVATGSGTVNSGSITDGSIVDADVNASASIAQSKIANLPSDLSSINTAITGINSTISSLTTTSVAEGTNLYFNDTRAISAPLTGFVAGTDSAIVSSDSILQAFNKTQGQINNRVKKTGDTVSGILTLDSDLKIKGGSNYVTLKGNALSANYNFIFPSSAGSNGQVLQTDGSGNLSWTTPSSTAIPSGTAGGDLGGSYPNPTVPGLASKISTTLNSGNILVGNGSNLATAVSMSGDAILSNTGVLTLASTVTAGTYSSVTVDGKGRVTAGSNPTVVTAVSVAAPITNTGTTSIPLIGMPAATGAGDGYLSAANFTTFNNKQNAITSATNLNTASVTTNDQNGLNLNPFGVAAGNTGEIRFYDLVANGSNYTGFKAPDDVTSNIIYTLPVAVGANGQVLTTNASGVLSWSTPSTTATPIGSAGGDLTGSYPNPTISNANLIALKSYNTNGFLVQTAANAFAGRSIAGTANRITVTNANGVSADPIIDIPSALLPSPAGGDAGKFLKATAANTSAWTSLGSSDITTALGFTPINKAGDTMASGTFNYNGAAVLRTLDPVGPTDVVTKQYVDQYGPWSKNGSDVYRASGNVGIGTSTPGYKLTVNGAISGGDAVAGTSEAASVPVWHSYLGQSADPSVVYIPLAYNQTAASGLASSGFEGQISVYRGSTGTYNSGTQYDVAVRTVYSNPVIYRFNSFGYQTGAQLVTLTYAAQSYIALQIPSNSSHDFYLTGKWWAFKPFILDSLTHAGQVSAVVAYSNTNLTTTSAGNVGIGTSAPAAKLEVAGGIKLGSMTACGAPQEGSQRYNSTLKIMEFCDGVAWQSFAASSAVPTGAIMAFDLATCPTGWSEYTAARGRFLRGINGAGVDPAGNRTPGSLQAEDWRGFSMTNTIQGGSSGYSHGPVDMGKSTSSFTGNLFVGMWSTPMAALGTKWNSADETRPINVGVLYCRKN